LVEMNDQVFESNRLRILTVELWQRRVKVLRPKEILLKVLHDKERKPMA